MSRIAVPSPTTLAGLLYKDTAEKTYLNDYAGGASHFSESSTADIFEVHQDKGGALRENVDDDAIGNWLNFETRASMRFLFIDALSDKPDKLPITESLFREVVGSLEISPRFIDNLGRQHMPGCETRRLPDGSNRHEMWYTAVLRSDGTSLKYDSVNPIANLTRQFAYWQRFCVWAECRPETDGVKGSTSTTYMVLRCPPQIKQAFFATFLGQPGLKLLQSTMAAHAFFVEKVILHTWDFASHLSGTLYTWVRGIPFTDSTSRHKTNAQAQETKASELQNPVDYTERSRAFLSLSRQIYQACTDLDILQATAGHLQSQSKWLNDRHHVAEDSEVVDVRSALTDIFSQITQEVTLLRTYYNLYLERSKIGIDECYAMTNQRDSETNISIAQASNHDNRSLRMIQILSTIFLPGSFVSSIFGMGFFSTTEDGAVFVVNTRWWIYLAVSIPLTVAIYLAVMYFQWREEDTAVGEWDRRVSRKPVSEVDLEAALRPDVITKKHRPRRDGMLGRVLRRHEAESARCISQTAREGIELTERRSL